MLPTIVCSQNVVNINKFVKDAINISEGEFWECGVYKGGAASIIHSLVPSTRQIRLFDSFEGLPNTTEHDNYHKKGDFNDVDFYTISNYFQDKSNVEINKGWVPDTFVGKEDCKIVFCHLDLDLYEGYLATLNFVWPRLVNGGMILFDDYNAPTCKGAKKAVDEFIKNNGITLHLDQGAYIIKGNI